jgi:hypothetical protein
MNYETPEIFELGEVEELTLAGCAGLQLDILDLPRIHCPVPSPEGSAE